MTCDRVEELIESIAGGDGPAPEDVRAHVETCARCAGSLAAAVRLERALRAAPALSPPPRFTASVLARVRRERWRADQQVDWAFNIAVAIAVTVIALGAFAVFNAASVTAGIMSAAARVAELATQDPAEPPPPALWSYVLVGALMATSLMVWRWAEKEPEP
jgi:anti-sigma factor RsiW